MAPMIPQRSLIPWMLFIGWGSSIAWLSLTPSPPSLHSPLLGWDKFQHASAYALLTFTGGWAFGRTRRAFVGAFFLAILYGGAMELFQGYFTGNRSADWLDELANLTGSGVAAALAILFLARKKGSL